MSECSVNQEFNKKIDFVEYTIYTDKLKKDEKRKIVLIAVIFFAFTAVSTLMFKKMTQRKMHKSLLLRII